MRIVLPLLLCVSVTLEAQVPTLLAGSRLQVETTAGQKVEGTLMAQTPESVTVAASGVMRTTLPSGSITRVKASQGKSRGTGAIKGMKIGAGIGAGMGLLLSIAASGLEESDEFGPAEYLAVTALYGVSGGMWGAAIGAIVGSEKWTTVYQRPFRVTLTPLPQGRIGLAVGLTPR